MTLLEKVQWLEDNVCEEVAMLGVQQIDNTARDAWWKVFNEVKQHAFGVWKPISSLPTAYQKGDWSGLRSDLILVKTKGGYIHAAYMYKYSDADAAFYNQDDFEVQDITHWTNIP